jgi:hypothetical protein
MKMENETLIGRAVNYWNRNRRQAQAISVQLDVSTAQAEQDIDSLRDMRRELQDALDRRREHSRPNPG